VPEEDRAQQRHLKGRHRLAVGQLRARLREAGEGLRGIRVLVVEDNLVNQMVVCKFLKLADIEPVVANNGREALDRLEAESYDAVLMDINMPVMGGIEATRCIRAREKFARLPIIALTAGVTPEEREKCLSSGMDDFLTKPVRPDILIEALRCRVGGIPSPTRNPQTSSPARFLRNRPGFDPERLAWLKGDDPAALDVILRDFHKSLPGHASRIVQLIETGDSAAACAELHQLKGVAGNLGANALQEACQTLEAALKRGPVPGPELLEDWSKIYEQTLRALGDL
jgi:CheY-like chemotaxis protein